MTPSASTHPAFPPRVEDYLDMIVRNCADDGRGLVSVVLFGSAAIGGWTESVSDVDLILVVPDAATREDIGRLRIEVERIELLYGLRDGAWQRDRKSVV